MQGVCLPQRQGLKEAGGKNSGSRHEFHSRLWHLNELATQSEVHAPKDVRKWNGRRRKDMHLTRGDPALRPEGRSSSGDVIMRSRKSAEVAVARQVKGRTETTEPAAETLDLRYAEDSHPSGKRTSGRLRTRKKG